MLTATMDPVASRRCARPDDCRLIDRRRNVAAVLPAPAAG